MVKDYDGFKIFDPDSIVETEITIDPVTQETYANGQAISFDPETSTINVENLGTFSTGMEIIINGRATGVKVSSATATSISLDGDPTQGSGLNEGDQIIFAAQLENFTKHSQVIGQCMKMSLSLFILMLTLRHQRKKKGRVNQH